MGLNKLPIEPLSLIKRKGWTLRTYRFYAKKHGVRIQDIIESYGTEDGFTTYDGLYSIAYNDLIRSPGRIRFTLMHEIGHIYLKHLEEFEQTVLARGYNGLSEWEYGVLELEAGIFASEVLSPYPILLTLNWCKSGVIRKYCGLSDKASKKRASQILNIKSNGVYINYGSPIMQNFYSFMFKKSCKSCGYQLINKDANYCPICGDKFIWGEGKMLVYPGYQLDQNSKATVCPRCGSKEMYQGVEYCHICGVYLINRCADIINEDWNGNPYAERQGCYKPAPGNARFCMHCGNPTTYYLNNLLSNWQKTKAQIEAEKPKLKAVSTIKDADPYF